MAVLRAGPFGRISGTPLLSFANQSFYRLTYETLREQEVYNPLTIDHSQCLGNDGSSKICRYQEPWLADFMNLCPTKLCAYVWPRLNCAQVSLAREMAADCSGGVGTGILRTSC